MASQAGVNLPVRLNLRSRGGCTNCRQRKRKCDEIRPSCGRCRRLQYQCEYRSEPSASTQSSRHSQRLRMKIPIGYGAPSDQRLSPGFESVPSYRIANHEDMRISFLLHSVFKGANTAYQTGVAGSALTVRTELEFASDENSLTYNCLQGMAMTYWGEVHKDQSMLSRGYNVRGQGLARLRAALTSKIDGDSGDLVASIAFMRLSDTILPKAGPQWVIHVEALTQVCRAIGPRAFQEPRMRRLLENNRWPMITASSVKRRPVILDEAAWKTVPWQRCEKDVLQTMLDVYAGMPNLRFLYDQMQDQSGDEETNLASRSAFQTAVHEMVAEVHRWRDSVDTEIAESVRAWAYDAELTPVIPLASDRPQLSFHHLHHSYAMILFNMVVIIITLYLDLLSEQAHPVASVDSPPKSRNSLLTTFDLPVEDPLQRAAIAADEIARIAPWLLQRKHSGAGALYLAGPAVVADQFWQRFDQGTSLWFAAVVSQVNKLWEGCVLRNPYREGESLKVLM